MPQRRGRQRLIHSWVDKAMQRYPFHPQPTVVLDVAPKDKKAEKDVGALVRLTHPGAIDPSDPIPPLVLHFLTHGRSRWLHLQTQRGKNRILLP